MILINAEYNGVSTLGTISPYQPPAHLTIISQLAWPIIYRKVHKTEKVVTPTSLGDSSQGDLKVDRYGAVRSRKKFAQMASHTVD